MLLLILHNKYKQNVVVGDLLLSSNWPRRTRTRADLANSSGSLKVGALPLISSYGTVLFSKL
jgi:hypothetical protein